MNSTDTTRRAVLAGTAAAIPAAAFASVPAFTAVAHDPIFAAIEEHRKAFTEYMRLTSDTKNDHDDLIRGPEVDELITKAENAALDLIDIRPKTLAGVVALLDYVHEFNLGGIISPTRRNCHSEHLLWPEEIGADGEKDLRGRDLYLPWAFWLMENVREALIEITSRGGGKAVQS